MIKIKDIIERQTYIPEKGLEIKNKGNKNG
jgi:hypothetical protein